MCMSTQSLSSSCPLLPCVLCYLLYSMFLALCSQLLFTVPVFHLVCFCCVYGNKTVCISSFCHYQYPTMNNRAGVFQLHLIHQKWDFALTSSKLYYLNPNTFQKYNDMSLVSYYSIWYTRHTQSALVTSEGSEFYKLGLGQVFGV